VLGVVNGVSESFFASAVANAEPVVGPCVAKEVGNRCITVTVIKDHHHVVDEIVNIEQDRITRISHAIETKALGTIIVHGIFKSEVGYVPQIMPGVKCAVSSLDRVAAAGTGRFDAVPIISVAAEIRRGICCLGALLCLEDAPIVAVNIEMVISASGVALAHQSLAVARPHFPAHGIAAVAPKAP